uniref:CCHC-type domain-containing protein n=1 Tax=Vitis vinifera TaxID=29760 RepID=F6HN80_VITVI
MRFIDIQTEYHEFSLTRSYITLIWAADTFGGSELAIPGPDSVVFYLSFCHIFEKVYLQVSSMTLDRSRSPPQAKRLRSSDRASYQDAPYPRDHRVHRQDYLCNKCKRPGHFARDCPNVTVCNNCGLPGHIAAECNSTTMCWNCKESGHLASQCPNDPVCHMCGKMGHLARDCSSPGLPAHDARLCNNCYKPGHIAADCTNEKACNNCHKTGHLARDCLNEPVCNICNISGHVARQCPKSRLVPETGGPFRDITCHNCGQPGHISRDCVSIVICNNCGGRGHQSFECPSVRMFDHVVRRY